MRFRVLGPLEVFDDDGCAITLESAKQRLLLAVLLCHRNHPVSVDRLIDVLWEGTPPKSCRTNLQVLIYRLRGALGKHRILSGPSGYRLVVEPGELDAERFQALAADGAPAEALALWHAEPYAGLDDSEVVRDEAARLSELRMATLEARIDADLAAGQSGQVISELRTLVDSHPLRERLRCQLMLALYRSGRVAEALDSYQNARQTMVDELGIEPGAELRQLQQAILTEDPALDKTEPDPEPEPRRPYVVPAELPPAGAAYTGRHTEADRLVGLLTDVGDRTDGSVDGVLPIVAISGPGGIGKSALAHHVAHVVADLFPDGQLYVNLRGATPGVTPLTAREVLGRFLRTLGHDTTQLPDDVDEVAAVFRSVAAGRRLLIVLDDVDDAAQVRPLLPGTPGSAVLLTSRRVPAALDGAEHVRLDGLSDDEAVVLLARLAGTERVAAEPDAAGQIVRLCGRLPLAVRIAGARLAARPDWTLAALVRRLDDAQRRLDELRHADLAVRSSLAVSYDALPPDAARLFDLLGSIDLADFCVTVSGLLVEQSPNAAQDLLDQLVEAQLLTPLANDRYTFHDLVRLYARERAMTVPEADRLEAARRVLHVYIATLRTASLLLYPRTARRVDTGVPSDQLAHPGIELSDPASAVEWIDQARENLVLLAHRPAPAAERAGLASALYMPLITRGYWTDLISVAGVLLQMGEQEHEPGWRARALHDLGLAYHRMRRQSDARQQLTRALAEYRSIGDQRGEANALNGIGLTFKDRSELARAISYYQAAVQIRRAMGDREGEARVLNNIGDNYLQQERFDEALPLFDECVTVYRELGERRSLGISLGNLAVARMRIGQPELAIPLFEEALVLRAERGDRWGEAACAWHFGEALFQLGKDDDARARWRYSLDIVSELGRMTAEEVEAVLADTEPTIPEPLRVYG